jgi:hypothetical protein
MELADSGAPSPSNFASPCRYSSGSNCPTSALRRLINGNTWLSNFSSQSRTRGRLSVRVRCSAPAAAAFHSLDRSPASRTSITAKDSRVPFTIWCISNADDAGHPSCLRLLFFHLNLGTEERVPPPKKASSGLRVLFESSLIFFSLKTCDELKVFTERISK